MTYDLVSLSIIMMIAVACPTITQLIPGKPMPQTVLLLVRAVPIFVATTLDHRVNPLDPQDKLTVSLYCTTALPLIVAVTSLAVQGGTMHQTTASTLVAAGAVTVFLMPLLGGLTSKLMKGETRLIAPTA